LSKKIRSVFLYGAVGIDTGNLHHSSIGFDGV